MWIQSDRYAVQHYIVKFDRSYSKEHWLLRKRNKHHETRRCLQSLNSGYAWPAHGLDSPLPRHPKFKKTRTCSLTREKGNSKAKKIVLINSNAEISKRWQSRNLKTVGLFSITKFFNRGIHYVLINVSCNLEGRRRRSGKKKKRHRNQGRGV